MKKGSSSALTSISVGSVLISGGWKLFQRDQSMLLSKVRSFRSFSLEWMGLWSDAERITKISPNNCMIIEWNVPTGNGKSDCPKEWIKRVILENDGIEVESNKTGMTLWWSEKIGMGWFYYSGQTWWKSAVFMRYRLDSEEPKLKRNKLNLY